LPGGRHELAAPLPDRGRPGTSNRPQTPDGAPGVGRARRGAGLLRRLGRRLLVVGLALVLALVPRAAWAHAVLFGSDPSPDAVLGAPPASVTLMFSETVIPAGKGIKVFSPSGRQVASPARVEGHVLTAPISSTEAGTYVVIWQALAADTHPSRGAFRFVVGQPSANPYLAAVSGGEIGTATPVGFVLQALARWIHFVGMALTFGIIAYRVLTR